MPSFTLLNIFNCYLVKEFNTRDVDDEMIKDIFKDAFSFTDFLKSLFKK